MRADERQVSDRSVLGALRKKHKDGQPYANETDIVNSTGMSRNSVRATLWRLEMRGLIKRRKLGVIYYCASS